METEIIKFIINFGGLAVALLAVYVIFLMLQKKTTNHVATPRDAEEISIKIGRIEKKVDYISNGIDSNSIDTKELKQMVRALEQDVKALREVVDKIRDDADA